jgi:hypothetical protein
MALRLTPKQEKFCRCIVSGMSGKDSYKAAYNTKGNDKTVERESRILLMRDDITERITELRKPLVNHAQNTAITERENHIKELQERIAICKANGDENSLIRYYDQIAKIKGLYKDTETETEKENTLSQLDQNTLLKLSGVQ